MHYWVEGLKLDIAPVDEFLRLMAEDGWEVFRTGENFLEYSAGTRGGVWVI
jgi:hypothetical protein